MLCQLSGTVSTACCRYNSSNFISKSADCSDVYFAAPANPRRFQITGAMYSERTRTSTQLLLFPLLWRFTAMITTCYTFGLHKQRPITIILLDRITLLDQWLGNLLKIGNSGTNIRNPVIRAFNHPVLLTRNVTISLMDTFLIGVTRSWFWLYCICLQLTIMSRTICMMTSSNGIISALLAFCAGNSPVIGEFPAQRPGTRSVDVFFYLRVDKRLRKQLWGWWFDTPSWSLWRHCHVPIHGWIIESCDWKIYAISKRFFCDLQTAWRLV